jgi:uncharacterized protein YegL
MMENDENNFYDAIYKLFYKFSQTASDQVGLFFSKKTIYSVLELNPKLSITIPLPKLIGEKYVFEGLVFENTDEGRSSLWALFLSTIYHLAAHAAVSDYVIYKNWRKNKTTDVIWKVIDFIEDVKAQRYLENNNEEIWKNILSLDTKLFDFIKKEEGGHLGRKKEKLYNAEEEQKKLEAIRTQILSCKDENNTEILSVADSLYSNRKLLDLGILPNKERHKSTWAIKFEKIAPNLESFGIFSNYVKKIDELWQMDERSKTRLLRKYQKHLKNLRFDKIVIPIGDLQRYDEIKRSVLPMVRKIRQQLRLIANLNDYPKIDQIGYVDMQMAIQAIAAEGATTEIFERDDIRRGEEAWVILVDTSASMRLRFEKIKEFAVCIAECANDLTGKSENWALFSFDNDFHILKDFKERYNDEVKARLGLMENGGLSLLPDALTLSYKLLAEDPREKKYIFLLTDGHPSGYDRIHEAFSKIIRKTEVSGITLIGIGVTKKATRQFTNHVRGRDFNQLVAKFITAYKTVASDM